MVCNLIDFRCVIMNELIGNSVLTVILGGIFFFIVASKLKLGFDTTIMLSIPLILIVGLMFTSFQTILAFITIALAILVAWVFQKVIGNS